jgi:hypothetical protein
MFIYCNNNPVYLHLDLVNHATKSEIEKLLSNDVQIIYTDLVAILEKDKMIQYDSFFCESLLCGLRDVLHYMDKVTDDKFEIRFEQRYAGEIILEEDEPMIKYAAKIN